MKKILVIMLNIVGLAVMYGQTVPASWSFVSNTGSNASVAVPSSLNAMIATRAMETNDAIGIFFRRNDSLICAGYGVWVSGQNLAITVWGDNDQTPVKDGLAAGEMFTFKVWDSVLGKEYSAGATYDMGDGVYAKDGIYVLSSLSVVTSIAAPTNVSAFATNKHITLSWTGSGANIVWYKVYRSLSSPASTYLDTTSTTSYTDTGLVNGTKYYYRVTAVHQILAESPFSVEVNAQPYNQLPHPATLNDINQFGTGRVLMSHLTFSSTGSTDADGTIDSVYWYINDKLASRQLSITSDFGPGTNKVTLVVRDNDGGKDSSVARVNRMFFRKDFNGPVYAGLSLLGDNILYAIASGDAVYRMDGDGNILFNLQVGGDIRSSSSIAYDTTVYIASSDKNLYAFSKDGNSLWPALPLGGELSATATVDSLSNRLYIGVSNMNFVAVNRSTGQVVWSFFADAPIRNSAVITLDRKLVFATEKGTVYGIDLSNLPSPIVPSWQLALSDTVSTSPAIDDQGYIYVGTRSGKMVKISMPRGQQPVVVWQMQTAAPIVGSPVIDGNGTIYIGSMDAKLYAVNRITGGVKWTFTTSKPIRSTPAISNSGNIYFGNDAGEFFVIDSNAVQKWYYKDTAAIAAPVLYQKGIAYVGTVGKRVVAFYDNADSAVGGAANGNGLLKTTTIKPPMWGTYQGNNQRTGLPNGKMITGVEKQTNQIPTTFTLEQNYPNPFNPSTTIQYALSTQSRITLRVYNTLGQVVADLVNTEQAAGLNQVVWNANIASGLYFYRLEATSVNNPGKRVVDVKKMILLK